MESQPRPWYKKKGYLVPLGVLGLLAVASASGNSVTPTASTQSAVVVQAVSQVSQVAPQTPIQVTAATNPIQTTTAVKAVVNPPVKTAAPAPTLSNDNYYTNVSGNQVHSPAYAPVVPAGASAQCGDGTYSFSQHRSGTCSHHGGVAQWF